MSTHIAPAVLIAARVRMILRAMRYAYRDLTLTPEMRDQRVADLLSLLRNFEYE